MIAARVILASQSAVRKSLLAAAGLAFDTASPGVDEDLVKAELSGAGPKAIAATLADRKALALATEKDALVIGADQTLEFEGRSFDKAADIDEARARLKMLRGKTHHLHAAVAVARAGEVLWRETVTASLTMRDFTDAFLETYLQETGGALSSVGCYELENQGVQLFARIEGDYFAILGLPMMGLLDCLRREGALAQ